MHTRVSNANGFYCRAIAGPVSSAQRNYDRNPTAHPGLTRVRCSQFLLFEFNRVLVYYTPTILKLTQLYYLYFFIQNEVPEKISFKLLGLGLNETELN